MHHFFAVLQKNDFFKLFPLIVCFVLIKSYENYQEKRMRNARAKRCAPSKIVLISGLGNKVFQLFTEITNLAAKVQLVTLCKNEGTSNSFVPRKISQPSPYIFIRGAKKRPYNMVLARHGPWISFFLRRRETLRDAQNSTSDDHFSKVKHCILPAHFNLPVTTHKSTRSGPVQHSWLKKSHADSAPTVTGYCKMDSAVSWSCWHFRLYSRLIYELNARTDT